MCLVLFWLSRLHKWRQKSGKYLHQRIMDAKSCCEMFSCYYDFSGLTLIDLTCLNFFDDPKMKFYVLTETTRARIGWRQKWLNLLSFCVSCEDLAVSISFVRCRKPDSFNASDIILSIRVLDHCKKYQTSWYQERLVCMDWGVKRRQFLKLT